MRFAGLVVVALAVSAVAASGCSHPDPPVTPGMPGAPGVPGMPTLPAIPPCATPEPLHISVNASKRLNPGESGEALATVVRIYQLKGSGKLTGSSFDELLDHDHDALGDDFINVQEVTINPGDKIDPPFTRNADAAYVAAVALFRQPAGSTWRAVRKLPAPNPLFCHASEHPDASASKSDDVTRFVLDENRIELQ